MNDMMQTPGARKIPARKSKYVYLILWAAAFFVLLLLRDAYSVGVNKYIFLILTCACAVTMKTDELIYFFCFLFPLYVGLPGNYMTLLLIVRILLDWYRLNIRHSSFILTLLVAVFVFWQNAVTEHTDIVSMMFVAGIVLILLLFSYKDKMDTHAMIWMYTAGVAALGFIMLMGTLQVYEFEELLSDSFRLGSSSVDYAEKDAMNVSIDPNFYGMFCMAAFATAVPLLSADGLKMPFKVSLICFCAISLLVALVGLSRSFLLVFIVWMLLYLFTKKGKKETIRTVAILVVVAVFAMIALPNVMGAIMERFQSSDMETGNGRFALMGEFFDSWLEGIIPFLFGVGLLDCNVHCMPLQFLFGGGIVLFFLVTALFFSYRNAKPGKWSLTKSLPMIVTFTMICTVPAAGLLNFMFPLVFVGLVMREQEK